MKMSNFYSDCYGEKNFYCEEQKTKRCIENLMKYNFPNSVINWIENELCNIKRRIHSFDENTMAAYVILGFSKLQIEYNIDHILSIMCLLKNKKRILELISGLSSKNTPIHYSNESIISRIIHPAEYILSIYESYCVTFPYLHQNKENNIKNIIHFVNIFVEVDERFLNFEAKTSGCAFIFFYIITFFKGVNKKNIPCKSDFKSIRFTFSNFVEKINPSNFDDCLNLIQKNYSIFFEEFGENFCLSCIIHHSM